MVAMNKQSSKNACVGDIVRVMEQLAPKVLAEEWDNCGLQLGSARRPVHKIWVALDPLPAVVLAAADQKVDLLITHHPLLLRPLRSIDVETPTGKIIETALAACLAIYSAHTNLDCAREGVNEILCRALGLKDLVPMVPNEAVHREGETGSLLGMGRIGRVKQPITLEDLSAQVKRQLNLSSVKVAGDPLMVINQVAVCSGSGSGLLETFLSTEAQAYISGDLRYHDARRVEEMDRALIDVGHFSSEHLVIAPLVEQLRDAVQAKGWSVAIDPCTLEHDPFVVR